MDTLRICELCGKKLILGIWTDVVIRGGQHLRTEMTTCIYCRDSLTSEEYNGTMS